MVDSSRRPRQRREVLTNHNRCWIWGRNAVQETLRAGRWPIHELLVGDRCEGAVRNEVASLASRNRIVVNETDDATLTKTCRSGDHQGLAARMAPFPYLDVGSLVAELKAPASLVVLDRIQDPFNFGAMIRSASLLGIQGMIVGRQGQVEVNSLVARSSAGAVNHIGIAQTEELVATANDLHNRGIQLVGASERSSCSPEQVDLTRSTCLIIGNEGRGIQPALLDLCDATVAIPMTGSVGSLNAAVAAGILFYELSRQRNAGRDPTRCQ